METPKTKSKFTNCILWQRKRPSLAKRLTFSLILRPIIVRDYRLREAGLRPDRLHWADRIACSWGFYI